MPHLTLDYTENLASLDLDRTLLALNETLVASGHFPEQDIKSRACRLDTWRIGTAPADRAFVHVKLAILSGRSPEIKSALSAVLLETLRAAVRGTGQHELQLCVEVIDIDRASYAKDIVHG